MNVGLDFVFIVGASVSVVGVVEWIKGLLPANIPSWVYRAVLLPVSITVAVAADGGVFQVATNSLALLAVTQIGYPLLIQLPTALIEAFRKKIG